MNFLDSGKYSVILADPPWHFKKWSNINPEKSASRHYTTMNLDDICGLPVRRVAADDCVLFIWTCWPHIFQTLPVIKAWGFEYSGLAWEWIKRNPETGKFAFGTGYGTRKNVEPCLLARRGKPKLLNRSIRDFLFAPRREHSRKPDEQYERIEAMFAGPYLELFSRARRHGWDSWGDETSKFEEKTPLKREKSSTDSATLF